MADSSKQANTYLGLIGLVDADVVAGTTPGDLIADVLPRCVPESGLARETRLYADPSGARIRISLDEQGGPLAAHVSFPAVGRLPVRLKGFVPRPEDTYADAHAYYEVLGGGEVLYPVVATVVDPHAIGEWGQDITGSLQLTVFPHRFEVFGSAADFSLHQQTTAPGRPQYAAKAFVPSGIVERDANTPAEPFGLFTGVVTGTDERVVTLTGNRIVAVAVETYGGSLTLVANRAAFRELPQAGNIVRAKGWLSGQFYPSVS
ncbi:MAG: hypothetical protein ACK4MQ_11280 [Hyphomonas sp.]